MASTVIGEIAERLRRSTVLIHGGPRGQRSGAGSGVIWSESGLIVTNAHVVPGSRARVQLWDGREFEAQVTERDLLGDLAALRISELGLSSVSVADSSRHRGGRVAYCLHESRWPDACAQCCAHG